MKLAPEIEQYRETHGDFGTAHGTPYGLFYIPVRSHVLKVLASDGVTDDELGGWEHVSVSLPNRCPNWDEMCKVKSLFWADDETVIQFHPKKTQYVNNHPYCLHLWKPCGKDIELPPTILV